jgi:UTP:GlnB (protein PII) uridylyltransferase
MGDCGLRIEISRITTEMDVAMDSFYVYGRDGEKITSTPAIKHLQEALHRAAVKNPE